MKKEEFSLDKLLEDRGTKKCGFIEFAHKVDSSMVRIPYMIVCGAEEGPIFLADCCIHGDEYEGAEAIAKLYNLLDPQKLKGTFVGVPAVNLEAFNAGCRIAPIDWSYLDMNRAFPGNPKGMITSRVANYYFENFIKKADLVISFHGGGNSLYLEPLATHMGNDTELGKITCRMAEATGMKVLWQIKDIPFPGGLPTEAANVGTPVTVIELGGQGVRVDHRDEMIQLSAEAMLNVLKEFNMITGDYVKIEKKEKVNVEINYVHSDEGGYHKLKVKPMDFVKEGQLCSEIVDIFGNKVGEVRAPFDCYIVGFWSYSTIHPGNWAFLFGKPL